MSEDATVIELLAGMVDPSRRPQIAARIAERLGADAFLVLVHDSGVNAFLPAPGFLPTLPGGPGWAAALETSRVKGRHSLRVEYPAVGETRDAMLWSDGHAALLLIGNSFDEERARDLHRLFPMLAWGLRSEQAVMAAAGQVNAAHDAARHAHLLSAALSAARADAEHALADTARLNFELKEADRRKNEFLAMLAHELRNPLSPIVTALQLVAVRRDRKESFDRELDIVNRQVSLLSRLVDDLLDVARITRGKIELRLDTLSLADVLRQAVVTSRPLIEKRRHELRVPDLDETLFVRADFVRLVQVFANLLNNAAKYTDEGGHIDLLVDRRDQRVRVAVRDDGIGLGPEILPRVFELFVQAPQSIDRAPGGLGVGLTLVKALVEMQQGEVSVTSEGPGRGSEFAVTLPLVEVTAARVAEPPRPTLDGAAQLHVLVVDDNADSAEMIAEIMRLWGHVVEIAHDGPVALRVAGQHSFDFVLLDIGLPGLDGYEVARRLRPMVRGCRVVALSGYGDEDHRAKARDAGFDDYLVKPVEPDALQALLVRAE